VAAEDEELAGLVGGEGEADVLVGEPAGELAGAGHLDPGLFQRGDGLVGDVRFLMKWGAWAYPRARLAKGKEKPGASNRDWRSAATAQQAFPFCLQASAQRL
jgi:hypothetical protein